MPFGKWVQNGLTVIVLAMSLVMTACSDEETPSAVDKGVWTINYANADYKVNPGDDFFMYCNGGFWQLATLDATGYAGLTGEATNMMKERLKTITLPSVAKLTADLARIDETTAQAEETINSALGRIAAVKTREEAWRLMGQLAAEGFQMPFHFTLFSKGGILKLCIWYRSGLDWGIANESMSVRNPLLPLMDGKPRCDGKQLRNNPELLAALRPVRGAATRGFGQSEYPMLVKLCEGMGVSPDDVFLLDADPYYSINYIEEVEILNAKMKELQDASVEELAGMMAKGVMNDNNFCSSKALESMLGEGYGEDDKSSLIIQISTNYLRYERSHQFAQAYVTEEMKSRALDYCEQLRQTYRERIAANTWLSEASKQNMLDKLDYMGFCVGCPDEWFVLPDLTSEPSFLDDVIALRRASIELKKQLIGKDRRRVAFNSCLISGSDLHLVNAMYDPNFNTVFIFPSFMMEPLFYATANEAIKYSWVYQYAHEITHAFDNNCIVYNKFGDIGDVLANEADKQEYQRRMKQLADLYSSMEVMPDELPGVYCDGEYTLNENLCDQIGFDVAYNTYLKYLKANGYKDEELTRQKQRFYLGYAEAWRSKYTAEFALRFSVGKTQDVHAMERERVNGVARNTDYWYELFDVKPTDKLYLAPEERVRIW